jgi:hypothetical protein
VKTCLVAALTLLVASSSAAAATRFTGVTSQKDTRLVVDVRKAGAKTRVVKAELHFTMDCDDGSTIERSAVLPGPARVTRGGRFRLTDTSGGLSVAMTGRFTDSRTASGTFEASSPATGCYTGTVGWVSSISPRASARG